MARAETYTWLPLDHWARLLGYNLYHFNGITIDDCQLGTSCGNIWYQFPEQHDTVSREELALAIRRAEIMISGYVGFNLLPDWDEEELEPPHHYNTMVRSRVTSTGMPKSLQLSKRHLISAGQKLKQLYEEGVQITLIDRDGDGFKETAQMFVDLSEVNLQHVHLYYPNEDGSDEWEIRPIRVYEDRIEFPVYLIVIRNLIEQICPEPLDGKDEDIYLEEADIYLVYNDTDVQAILKYNQGVYPCPSPPNCTEVVTGNCVTINNKKLGYVVYNPRLLYEPDMVELKYFSGWQGKTHRPLVDIDEFWRGPIAYLAIGLLDKEPRNCCGGNESFLVSQWKEDTALSNKQRSYFTTPRQVENIFGLTTKGAWFALKQSDIRRLP